MRARQLTCCAARSTRPHPGFAGSRALIRFSALGERPHQFPVNHEQRVARLNIAEILVMPKRLATSARPISAALLISL